MRGGIGWYVHHQGAGHLDRARRVAASLSRPCTLIGTFHGRDPGHPADLVLDLPDDRPIGHGDPGFGGVDGEAERPLALHYAPLNHPGLRARTARIAAWAARTNPALLVVDVSVEVALFARLLSLPTLVVRLAGRRDDPPHLEAFRAASGLIAPFPEALEDPATPDWVRAKTVYAGLLAARAAPSAAPEDGRIVVLLGSGGAPRPLADLAAAARAVPERAWHVLGTVEGEGPVPDNLHLHGFVADVLVRLAPASLVVGACGDGTLAAVAGAAKRFLCLPEPRAFGEQALKAEALARLGAAVVHEGRHDGWPAPDAWPDLVSRALALDPTPLARLADPDAIPRTAAAIEAAAARLEARG
ncbi:MULTISPECIES: glycosyltransferase [Methylobacterium]|uniref:Glycosyltransferase n=6 Tax=Pseudomonadota TaxID=1224 RepID=A0ABQ4SS88_9HYPH|nr:MULTISPECIES: glycosyltransferase [Methylobacterium]PIU06508.1 MAG: glycosyltransferase [Methylobacterium sp. CG09_land_8_20_14_0_10_71_15]PIU16407.1 MAG: glycosyltransferase [Methylobacterium sp. CG08_land_8_20_14_0_20_71_15]GBU16465.1 hypothetical protein AwMethylo_06800 [Methylobacterium sp.]GJE06074.1 hypothetical protein AOPFMNJM_1380 [Methylobacterium jeotgali]